MTYSIEVNYHTHGPSESERGTAVTVTAQSRTVVIGIGDGGTFPDIRIYIDRAAEAFALAKAFASAGEVLEQRAGSSRVAEVPTADWVDIPLPLDEPELCGWRSEDCRTLGCRSEKCPAF